jgi:nitrite reductase/ring-hydroxylating ferredoxin subunit
MTPSTVSQPSRPADGTADVGNDRRSFFEKLAAVVIGGVVVLFPFAAGLAVFFDPLRRKSHGADFVRVTSLGALPDDGIPRLFQVIRDKNDAWSRHRNEPVGAVYLRRSEGKVTAHNAECPHAGCYVGFLAEKTIFQCPCHDSSFQPSGERIDPLHCPSPRDLDPLAVEIRAENGDEQVWVKFESFLAGTSERIRRA